MAQPPEKLDRSTDAALAPETPKTAADAQVTATEQAVVGVLDRVREYPTFSKSVASFSPDSAEALKQELGLKNGDVLVGLPPETAAGLEYEHGNDVALTLDGKTAFMAGRPIKVVTRTPKGDLSKLGLSKGIRDRAGEGFKDHRETGTGTPDTATFTVVMINGAKHLWLKKASKAVEAATD